MPAWKKIDRGAQQDLLGEGTLWCPRDGAVYWVDILAPALNRLTLATGAIERWDMPEPLGWVVTRAQGGLVGGFQSGIATISLDPFEVGSRRAIEPSLPGNRMNDGKTDPAGAIWCGTMDMAEQAATGSLYRITSDGAVNQIDTGYLVPNGPAFSPCGRWMYHSDSARRSIYRFALDRGTVRKEAVLIQFSEADGYPDGMTTDSKGRIWVAHWDAGRITCFAPDGTRELAIDLPARRVTNITFASERLDRMFVTTACIGTDKTEFDGALFEISCDAVGVAPVSFSEG